ncbi:6-phosphogluconolactonase [Yoonia vestfoldensis]|jgi:6-phosphogluconolactonase|uniref:6-phosphogluconolactonase n=1 Tax=Yoonia vestfoldensis SKA53 TaxID=314232 RepID=A3V4G1_9RHOB|nr:6-phosphogluconolactonase [Yoonia vestfoldensis]EAQ07368.1 6-phosphogluconolactonase [Yoonia vestfoldensis SKA53]
MDLIEYPDAELMMMRLADVLASQIKQALLTQDRASLAVPGGTTPGPIFDTLCAVDLDWSRVDVLLTDERWVPETSDRSNTALLRRRLLVNRAAAARLIPLYADAQAPEDRLADLAAGLEPVLPLSVVLLGMGADMHTASLFAGADQLELALTGDAPLVAMRAPGAPEPRITLSAAVLNAAMRRHIVIVGAEKRAALDQAQGLDPQDAPVAAVLKDTTVHWAEA